MVQTLEIFQKLSICELELEVKYKMAFKPKMFYFSRNKALVCVGV
jgi:hypothetical protein